MCRLLAYRGDAILREARATTNGDGFCLGWYGERVEPGLYREVHPAWSDESLRSICAQVRSRLFFAHVRASTGTATSRANCHFFAARTFMFRKRRKGNQARARAKLTFSAMFINAVSRALASMSKAVSTPWRTNSATT